MKLNYIFNFTTLLKVTPTSGNIVYEYNPFLNYRLTETMIEFENKLWSIDEFVQEYNFDPRDENNTEWPSNWSSTPIVHQAGELVNFETDELHFSLNNPVNILAQYSYDNSVNLIINDGLNPPRLINSRFSTTERNKYQICDRKNNNDSNIYDQGLQFDTDTSLYKKTSNIPYLQFLNVGFGGNLKIGNYHFYFRYIDDDGNMSDFFAESGLVSIFIGNTADSIHSGFRDENSHKLVKFSIDETDPSYQNVVVYYTRATGEINQSATVNAYKIDRRYKLLDSGATILTITGYEEVDEVDITEINPTYQIYGAAETQEQCQNMLFLGNVERPNLPYEDLADCALRFLPFIDDSVTYPIKQLGTEYTGYTNGTYCDPSYIYNKVGYHCGEIYRFGIVFIQSDNTLTEVFNVRGTSNLQTDTTNFTQISFRDDDGNRNYINFDEQYYNIINESKTLANNLENAKGVVRIPDKEFAKVIGINFKVNDEVFNYLKDELGIRGFFFVRQKRIPTLLCQAYTIGIDAESNTPVIPYNGNYITESFINKYEENSNDDETSNSRILTHTRKNRIRKLDSKYLSDLGIAAICPDYDVDAPYYNSLFTGSNFRISEIDKLDLETDEEECKHFRITTSPNNTINNTYLNVKIIGVEDNVKLVAINNALFSGRAGEAEEGFRFEYLGYENDITKADNLLRGSYGPYLGITGYKTPGYLVNIMIPGYAEGYMQQYFEVRFHDKSPFYAISYRINIEKEVRWFSDTTNGTNSAKMLRDPLYRGDCYICQFTHRVNRNFQDPSAPINDKIVDRKCWKEHYEVEDDVIKIENFEYINLGDLNAVKEGMYITLFVHSTNNLNVRALDESVTDEIALTGHPRGYYPYHSMTNSGAYKTPEALCYNKGFQKSVSEKINVEVPDVPWIKNEFSNRIAYSQIQIIDAFENGWRIFPGTNYRDYPKTYGSIVKLVELRGNIVCVFEHGVALIPINERALSGQGNGGNVYVNTSNVLPENPNVISDTFGSQWRESVIKTPYGIYGVDTVGKKIWRTNGQTFECISEFHVQEFLNENISLTERELTPIIGIRNVKTHYNKFKHDVMFTFYDNLYGFEEKVWNLCYNEALQKWITFYSWVPSYSENIFNQYFSFDRNTSKWIAKLGISNHNNDFSDGVTVKNNIITSADWDSNLYLDNRTLPEGDNITFEDSTFELERDNYLNYKNFKVTTTTSLENNYPIGHISLKNNVTYADLCSELYERVDGNGKHYFTKEDAQNPDNYDTSTKTWTESYLKDWKEMIQNESCYWSIAKDENGRRIFLDKELQINPDKIVIYLNIKANVSVGYNTDFATDLEDALVSGEVNRTTVDAGYYQSVVTLITKYNMQFLTTDFWKHGQGGIIDIADKIYPTYWYGKQHPFEFEFVVNDQPTLHKIFDNLEIISNKAEPESLHYEIIGDCFDFADDKKNMYIRQEATKELYQYNGVDVTYDHDYSDLEDEPRESGTSNYYDKSTILPLWFTRQDTINEIEDYYHLKDGGNTKDFSTMAGGEIVRYKTLGEYRIWNHAQAVDITKTSRLRGNMHYREDKWYIQINPLNIVQKNETPNEWTNNKVPVELGQSPLPSKILNNGTLEKPSNFNRNIVSWNWVTTNTPTIKHSESKIKDKFMKVRIRYTGNKLAVVSAVTTLYSISYS